MIQYVGAHSVSLWSNSRGSKDSTYTWFNVTNKCLSVCSVRNTPPVCITDTSVLITSVLSPPQGCSESFPGCHFPKCLRLRSSSALVSQTWCNLPDSNPQWSPTFLVPVPWTGSFDHSFSPAPYQLTHGPVLAHEPGLGCLSCREFQRFVRGFLIMIWWVFKVLVTQFELQFDKNVTLFNRKLQTRHCFNNWWSYFLMFYSSGK